MRTQISNMPLLFKVLFVIVLLGWLLISINLVYNWIPDTGVSQHIQMIHDKPYYFTFVRYKGEIIESYYVPIGELNDSIKKEHKQKGERLLKTLNK